MKRFPLVLALTCAMCGLAHAESLRTGVLDDQIWVENATPGMDLNVRVLTPWGEVIERIEPAQWLVTLDVAALLPGLPDGDYNYEVSLQPPADRLVTRDVDADFSLPAEAFGGVTPAPNSRAHGQFEVVDGHLFATDAED